MSTHENLTQLLAAVKETPCTSGTIVVHPVGDREVQIECLAPNGYVISHFDLSLLPGCRYVIVFHKVSVRPEYRNKGFGKALHQFRLDVAKRYGASLALCTTLDANSVENRILCAHGWTATTTGTPGVSIWSKAL